MAYLLVVCRQATYIFNVTNNLIFIKHCRLKTDSAQEEAQKNVELEDELHELREEFQHQCSLLHDSVSYDKQNSVGT